MKIKPRYIEGLKAEFGQADDNFFMLDENLSHLVLRDLVRIFGPSSHVRLEDLSSKSDEMDIWPYMIRRRYKALLTADSDFKPISVRHRGRLIDAFGSVAASSVHTPVVIHIGKNISCGDTLACLQRHELEIRHIVAENNCAYASIDENGIEKHEPDAGLVERNFKIVFPHRGSFSQPSSGPVL